MHFFHFFIHRSHKNLGIRLLNAIGKCSASNVSLFFKCSFQLPSTQFSSAWVNNSQLYFHNSVNLALYTYIYVVGSQIVAFTWPLLLSRPHTWIWSFYCSRQRANRPSIFGLHMTLRYAAASRRRFKCECVIKNQNTNSEDSSFNIPQKADD